MNNQRIFFPSNYHIFVGDNKLQHQIKSLESYHEITYDMLDIKNSIIAINRVAPQDEKYLRDKYSQCQINESLTSELEELYDSYVKAEKNPVQKMRDALEEIKRDFDTATILLFLCPQFFLSVETMMSGAVVTYIKAFNSSKGRSKLNADDVFAGNSDLKKIHINLENLRNKHFAHTELQANKHYLQFIRENKEDILMLDRKPPHEKIEFYREVNLIEFNKCVSHTILFLEKKIDHLSGVIESSLTEEQKKVLHSISIEDSYKYSNKNLHSHKNSRK